MSQGPRQSVDTLRNELSRVVTETGLPVVTPHRLRHSYATAIVKLGVSLQALMALLGHVSAETSPRTAGCSTPPSAPTTKRRSRSRACHEATLDQKLSNGLVESNEHQDPPANPYRPSDLIHEPQRLDFPCHAQRRWVLPAYPAVKSPEMTHGASRRSLKRRSRACRPTFLLDTCRFGHHRVARAHAP